MTEDEIARAADVGALVITLAFWSLVGALLWPHFRAWMNSLDVLRWLMAGA